MASTSFPFPSSPHWVPRTAQIWPTSAKSSPESPTDLPDTGSEDFPATARGTTGHRAEVFVHDDREEGGCLRERVLPPARGATLGPFTPQARACFDIILHSIPDPKAFIVVVVVVVVVVVETNPFVPVFSLVPLCRTIGLPVPVPPL